MLIAAITRKRHRDTLLGQLAHAKRWNCRTVGIGFVVKHRQFVQQIEVFATHRLLKVVGVIAFRYPRCVLGFIELLDVKADRTGIHRLILQLRHHGDNSTGINTAGEKRTQRHFRYEPHLYGLTQPGKELRL